VGGNVDSSVRELHDDKECFVHGYVPDLDHLYDMCDLVVAPVRLGSGTRLKVLESLARGKALVATTTAVEGLDVRSGIHLEVADQPHHFATACARLLADEATRQALAHAGRHLVMTRYRWQAIGDLAKCVVEGDSLPLYELAGV
jgi:glycosyltransferase involved in cell wall biosynthesis